MTNENNPNLTEIIKEIHDGVAREMYCKGVDDFKSRLEERILNGKMIDEKFAYIDNCDIDEIAEQLKEKHNEQRSDGV